MPDWAIAYFCLAFAPAVCADCPVILHHECVLFGDLVIAHSLIEELGDRRTKTFLALLECPELELAPADREAYGRFVQRLSEQFGPDCQVVTQLESVDRANPSCPEQ